MKISNIRLVQWYGYEDEIIPVSDGINLFLGNNGSGKSTCVDAIKYALYSCVDFNSASKGSKSDRTIASFTRKVRDEKAMRPTAIYPRIHSYIVLEVIDELKKEIFCLCTYILTKEGVGSGSTETRKFIAERYAAADLPLTTDDGENAYVNDIKYVQHLTGVKHTLSATEGTAEFLRRCNINLNEAGIKNLRKSIENLCNFNPELNISEYMKRYFLPTHPIDLKKCKEAKQALDSIVFKVEQAEKEQNELLKIINKFDVYNRQQQKYINAQTCNVVYEIKNADLMLDNKRDEQESLTEKAASLEKQIENNKAEKRSLQRKIDALNDELKANDSGSRIVRLEADIEAAKINYEKSNAETRKIGNLQNSICRFIEGDIFDEFSEKQSNVMFMLNDPNFDISEKEHFINLLETYLYNRQIATSAELNVCNKQIEKAASEIQVIKNELEDLRKNKINISGLENKKELIKKIKYEFEKNHIHSDCKFLYEYVANIKDTKWQRIIEIILDDRRFDIIVDPAGVYTAKNVLERNNIFGAVVRTDILKEIDINCSENTLYKYIDATNDYADLYLKYLLGSIDVVSESEIMDHNSGVTEDGLLNLEGRIRNLKSASINEYCLGLSSVKYNIEIKTEKYNKAVLEHDQYLKRKNSLKTDETEILEYKKILDCSPRFELLRTKNNLEQEIIELESKLKEEKENAEKNGLFRIMDDIEKEKKALSEKEAEIMTLDNSLQSYNKRLFEINQEKNALAKEKVNYINQLEELKNTDKYDLEYYYALMKKSVFELEKEKTDNLHVLSTNITSTKNTLEQLQNSFNFLRNPADRIRIGVEYEGQYRYAYNKLKTDDYERLKNDQRNLSDQYNDTIKKDLVMRIYNAITEQKDIMGDINRALKKMGYSKKDVSYRFEIKPVSDESDFGIIYNFGKLLNSIGSMNYMSGQMIMPEILGYDRDEYDRLEKSVDHIVSKLASESDLGYIETLSDYRNYLEYKMMYTDGEYEGDLESSIGSKSGGEMQMPGIILFTASLLSVYNIRENCLRLAFLDECFNKMDSENTGKVIDFFKLQGMQFVLASPNMIENCDSYHFFQADNEWHMSVIEAAEEDFL